MSTGATINSNNDDDCSWNVRIVWSTESGRAKACARRTARILRESYQRDIGDDNSHSCVNVQSVSSLEQDELFRRLLLQAIQPQPQLTGNDTETAESSQPRIILTKTMFICFISTTGDGEHCESIRPIWKSL